ncbi:DUF4365 domain-containing protein [uncultured Brachybacterium sp.]|uniref:DUF4365 domain-containing protein n=1 Tax=uncultured Brachybacterium sp. TaxID=189680 RepID=UPI00262E6B61|nr:DUF4365 domain-containing protein [uncultured Brachybacterium sp.]
MTTPVHSTKMTGSRGELKAQVIFADIGWAPPVKLSEDIGTDLVTFARDEAAPDGKEDTWDLGAPVFMQVKASPTEYLKPTNRHKGKPGWWFAESDTYHFDHWLSFGLPYLLVLVDVDNQIAYWAEVNGDAIVSTGKGRKIFVPFAQTVDETNTEALTEVAVSKRKYALEGAAWSGKLNELGPSERLRTAMVLPRLIAPHPNRATEEVSFEEAVAMVLRNRYTELAHRAGEGQCPKVEDWENNKEWSWRFVHALQELLSTGRSDQFEQLATNARHRFERDASLVVQACIAYKGEQAQDAVDTLVPSSATKPADRGWLLTHKAAFLFELDKPKEAVDAAKKALVATRTLDGDLSVSAIRGAAASILYANARFGDGDLEATVTAQDHAGNWWRAQDVSWSLEKDLKYRFEGWTANNTMHFINNTARDDLATIAWTAAFSGSWNSWRHLTAINAKLTFTSTSDPTHLAAALGALIFIGEKKAAKDAARKMWLDGPVDTLHSLVNAIAYHEWTKRNEGATMAVLAKGGDLLSTEAADHVVQRILDLLKNQGPVRVHGSAWSYRWHEADATFARVLTAASTKSHKKVADLIAADFATCDDSLANSYLRIVHALAVSKLNITRINNLCRAATKRTDHYRVGMLEALGPVNGDAIAELRKEAADGSSSAVRALLVVGSTDHDDFIAFGKSAAKTVRTMVENARGKDGSMAMTGYANDQLDDLVLAALNTNDRKLWKEVTDALEACVIEETQQQRAVRRLAARFPDLPQHVQRKLRKLAPNLCGRSFGDPFGGTNEYSAAVTHLRIAAGTIPDPKVEALLLNERRDSPLAFVRTLAAWNSDRKLPFLATMIVDENPSVRAQAGFSLIEHAHQYPNDCDRTYAVIRSALMQEDGCALFDGLAQGLAEHPTKDLADLEKLLRNHKSATVRARFESTQV